MAKLYVPERESKVVQKRLEAEDEVCASELMRPEIMAVFHRRLREGRWSRSSFLAATRQFMKDDLSGFWSWLPLDKAVTEATAKVYTTLAEDVFLRTADCMHLVTALRFGFAEVYTHDRHQTQAAPALGLTPIALR